MLVRFPTAIFYGLLIAIPGIASAQSPSGAAIVRIPDTAQSRCINGSTDVVWLTLRRVITDKSKKWLSEDKSVAIMITTLVRTNPQSPKAISFPLLTDTNLRGYAQGQVSLPIEYTLIDTFPLKQDGVRYTGLEVDVTLLNKAGVNAWGHALQVLADVTKKVPIPANPMIQAASYLLDFTNSAVTKDLADQNGDDVAKSAALALNFDPTGTCAIAGQDFERTGTIAVVQSTGISGPGLVPLDRVDAYCWSAELRPAFILKAAPKGGTSCDDPKAARAFFHVTNNYSAFVLSAMPAGKVLGDKADADRKAALRRCDAHGLPHSACIGKN